METSTFTDDQGKKWKIVPVMVQPGIRSGYTIIPVEA